MVDGSDMMKAGCCVGCLVFIVVIILVILGFSSLEFNEIGLDYSANSMTIDMEQTYGSGITFLGVGHSFIKYPKDSFLKSIPLEEIKVRTSDGLEVRINSEFTYSLDVGINKEAKLATLYILFEEDYETAYVKIARQVVRDVCSGFTAFEFFSDRDSITQAIQTTLDTHLREVYARVANFLLRNYELPPEFKAALTATDVALELSKTKEFDIIDATTKARTLLETSNQQSASIIRDAEAQAKIVGFETSAIISAINATIEAEILSLTALNDTLALSSSEFLSYIWIDNLKQARKSGATVQYGLKPPRVFTNPCDYDTLAGPNCDMPVCGDLYGDAACNGSNGTCTAPGTCTCTDDSLYTGANCDEPVCFTLSDDTACNGVNGTCTAPDTCSCLNGFTGPQCTVAPP